MKILVVNNMAPFIWGGAEELALHLRRNLELAGHQSEILRIPFKWEPAAVIPSQILMCKFFELLNVDKVIALKFPAYTINHPNKTIWLLHQYRQAYDLYDAGQTNLPAGDHGNEIREIIKQADNAAFSTANKIFTNSAITQKRLQQYNQFSSEVLLPPLNDPELFRGGEPEGYIFAGGRINNMKRQYLLIEALALTPAHVKLIIAGPPDNASDAEKLTSLANSLGVADRVKLDLRYLSRQELAMYVNHALACAYLPFDEDSLGYVAMEAANASKALITTSDSGGILELVRNNETGWVVDPVADLLAEVMTKATDSVRLTQKKGESGKALWLSFDITWAKTIERLLQ